PAAGTLSYASAGHIPPRLLRCADGSLAPLNRAQRLPLGIKPDEVYTEQTVPLATGDQVVFFTDGVTEAVNPDGEVFGSARIDAALAGSPPTSELLLRNVLAALTEFTAGTAPG